MRSSEADWRDLADVTSDYAAHFARLAEKWGQREGGQDVAARMKAAADAVQAAAALAGEAVVKAWEAGEAPRARTMKGAA